MTGSDSPKTGAILLAAGSSSRLGSPKQLVEIEGRTLIRRAADAILAAECDPIIVIVGSEPETVQSELGNDERLRLCINPDWRTGMSSSIKAGLRELLAIEPALNAVLITLCDQPFVDAGSLDRLLQKFEDTRVAMVASRYKGVVGAPAIFSREMFNRLAELEGDKGARALLRDPEASIAVVDMEEAADDIDTADDVDRLLASRTQPD